MYCACCGGELTYLGALGNLVWFRCRNCGADQYGDIAEVSEELIEIDEDIPVGEIGIERVLNTESESEVTEG